MIDDVAKAYLHDYLREVRAAMLAKIDGLSEYDVRRPLTVTGTNLLGLIKHLATWEARYFGEVFDRPFPEPLPRWQDEAERLADLWATEHENRTDIVDRYRRVWAHSDATIDALALDAPGQVAWWPRRHPPRGAGRSHRHGRGEHGPATARRGPSGRSGARPSSEPPRRPMPDGASRLRCQASTEPLTGDAGRPLARRSPAAARRRRTPRPSRPAGSGA